MTELSDLLTDARKRGLLHLSITPLSKPGWWQVSGRWTWSQGGYRVAVEESAEAALRKALTERPDMAPAPRLGTAADAPRQPTTVVGGVFD